VAVEVSGGSGTFYHEWAAGFEGRREGDTLKFQIIGFADDPFSPAFAELIDQTKWLTRDGTAVARRRQQDHRDF
jgi:hypothetical protein